MKKQGIVRKIAMGIICLSMVVTSLGMSGFTQVVYASGEGDCSDCNATGEIEGQVCTTCGGKGHLHDNYSYPYIEMESDENSHSKKCTKPGCDWSMEWKHDMFFSGDTQDIINAPTCTEAELRRMICRYGCTYTETIFGDPPLGHELGFESKSGTALTYKCRREECDRSVTLNVSAPSTTYSGNDNLAIINANDIGNWSNYNKSPLPTFTYAYKSTSDGEYVATTDTKKVGYYKATIPDASFSIEYEISKATPTLSFTRLSDKSNNIQGLGVTLSPADASANIIVEYQILITPAVEGHACSMAEEHIKEDDDHTPECGYVAAQEAEYEWTTTKPTAVGSYPVRAYMPEGTDNLNAVAEANAVTGTYVVEQYVAPNKPSGGNSGSDSGSGSGDEVTGDGGTTDDSGAGDSETGDSTTIETKPDGTTVETKTETSDDGTKTETVVESKPDGTKTEKVTEEKPDGSKTETITEEKADGSKTEIVTETAKDGSTVETKTETAKDGTKTESITETSADGKTSSSIEVKTDANGKVTESVVAVDKEVKGKKLTIDMSTITDMIAKNDNATKKNTTVVLTANDKNGKEKFTVDVDAKKLKAGAELKIYAIDKKENPVIVDASKNNVTITKNGEIKLNIAGTGDFTIVTPKEALKIEKAIEKSVMPAKTQVTVNQGEKAIFKLDSGCNKDNIAKITYTSDNANVKVNKNGKINVKDAGKATITATVTLANGKTKTIEMKVKSK